MISKCAFAEIFFGMACVFAVFRIHPDVWHMNEGHSSFLAIERALEMSKADLRTGCDQIRKTNVFTTHTPVPAGNDQFPLWLVDKYFS